MDDYVEVGRRFAEFDPSASSEAEDLWFLYASEYSAPLTWKDLLPCRAAVIIAEGQARRVPNVEEFLQAIERANADVFATRPADLLGLISLWNATRKIENYTKVVENNINRKLLERNPRHEHAAGLSAERALYGAQQLAVAITLSRKLGLSVPGQTVVSEQAGQCLSAPAD